MWIHNDQNKCWIHLAHWDNLRIKPSTIPNAGLEFFSYKFPFEQYHKLGKYTGRLRTNRKLEKKYKGCTPPNAICKSTENTARCVDANWSMDGALRYANDMFQNKNKHWYMWYRTKISKKIYPHWRNIKTNQTTHRIISFLW